MSSESDRSGSLPACPACDSLRVARGNLTAGHGDAPSFSFQELNIDPWKFIPKYPELQVRQKVWVCVECGLLWSRIDRSKAKRQIEAYGTAALKARILNPVETLPRPACAPELEESNLPLPARPNGLEAGSDP